MPPNVPPGPMIAADPAAVPGDLLRRPRPAERDLGLAAAVDLAAGDLRDAAFAGRAGRRGRADAEHALASRTGSSGTAPARARPRSRGQGTLADIACACAVARDQVAPSTRRGAAARRRARSSSPPPRRRSASRRIGTRRVTCARAPRRRGCGYSDCSSAALATRRPSTTATVGQRHPQQHVDPPRRLGGQLQPHREDHDQRADDHRQERRRAVADVERASGRARRRGSGRRSGSSRRTASSPRSAGRDRKGQPRRSRAALSVGSGTSAIGAQWYSAPQPPQT